jgi:hypothetical protein
MTESRQHPRFVRADIVRHPDGGLVVSTPRGPVLRVHLEQAELVAILAQCDGHLPLTEVAAKSSRTEDLLALLLRLESAGCLSTLPADRAADWTRFTTEGLEPGRLADTSLVVLGHGRLASAGRRLIGAAAPASFRDITYLRQVAELADLSG